MYPRFIEPRLAAALADTRVVLLSGPRQSGKTTLAKTLVAEGMSFLSLDDLNTLNAARRDPIGFIRDLDRAVIDEIQRAPDLLLAIKQSVDGNQRPGRFLLTGSADLMSLPRVADSLAGRMEILELLPLSPAEVRGTGSHFIERLFQGKAPLAAPALNGEALVASVLAGGYPEALKRNSWARRQSWQTEYIHAIMRRDIRDIAQIEQVDQMPKLLRMLAHHSGQLVNYSSLGAPIGMTHVTTQKYVGILEQLFLVRRLEPWFTNELKRLIKTPKVHFLDTGLLAALRNLTPQRVRAERSSFGPMLETFVFGEILKLASWSEERFQFYHYRDKDQAEVDIVMEDAEGRLVGIEVKASATVAASDFSGLGKLAEVAGSKWMGGVVLCDHDQILSFGKNLFAAPVASLWA